MKPQKTLYLKTYGKQMRTITAWISSEERHHRRAFDSTPSSDDTSVFEAAKTRARKKDTKADKEIRPAKRKALLCLSEKSYHDNSLSDENICPQSKNTRGKCTGVDIVKKVGPARRKATLCATAKWGDEENLSDEGSMFCPSTVPASKSRKTRKSRHAPATVFTRQKGQRVSISSESEIEISAPKRKNVSAKRKAVSKVHCPAVGRFVTHRRRIAATKPHVRKISILNSSEDFTSGEFCSSRTFRPPRKRRVPPAVGLSSTESSMNAAGTSSFTTVPFREISLNESGDHSLGPCSRKPIFCSTPSAHFVSKQGHSKLNQVPTPPSVSVSCIGVLNTFQEDLDPTRQPFASQQSASRSALSDHNKEQSPDLFLEPERGSCSEGAEGLSGHSEANHDWELPSVVLLSEDSESHFISAAGGLEWLIEALKQKCLSRCCTVQLERLAFLPVTQLYSQTTYSSCLEHSSSVDSQQTNPPSQSLAESLQHHDFVTNSEHWDYLQSVNSFNLSASASDRTNGLPSDGCKESDELSNMKSHMEQSESLIYVGSTQHTDHSSVIITYTQVPSSTAVQTLFTEEEAKAAKDKCASMKCTVQLKKLSQLQLKGFTQQKEVGAAHERFINANESGEKGSVAPFRESKHCSAATMECTGFEKEAELTLKEKCPAAKKKFQPKGAPSKSSTDGSESTSNDQTGISLLTESDSDENAASSKGSTRHGSSPSSETASGKEAENARETIPTREKMPLAPKNKTRSMFTQQTGTARKACVSGMSVSRWKNKNDAGTREKMGSTKMMDCSIGELISKQRSQPKEAGATMNFSSPSRVGELNLQSLLSDLSPNTHTWSRLKSALSVHRKVQLTPRSLHLSTPGRSMLADVSHDLFASPRRVAFPSHFSSQLLSQHSLQLNEDADLSDAEKVYAECGQQHPLPWEECILPHRMKRCVKIGEGTFGEVFSTTTASGETVALKIIPVEGREKVNGEDQKTFGEILHEIIISKELGSLKEKQQNQTCGFIGLNDLHCVQGCYPADFLKAWDAFDRRKVSENDRPGRVVKFQLKMLQAILCFSNVRLFKKLSTTDFFENKQLFIILEFEFGGIDLENSNGKLASLAVAKSILHQVTAALAVAEQELHFEHRDLHWGNVLVKTTKQTTVNVLLNERPHSVKISGVLVSIIDYSLSRLEIDDLTVSCDISNDEELFSGQGDYQFDIYRLMRQENGNNWSEYHPHSNVLWLHYLCSKLLSMKYRSSRGKAAKNMRTELTGFYNDVLQYRSATEALQSCPMFQQD